MRTKKEENLIVDQVESTNFNIEENNEEMLKFVDSTWSTIKFSSFLVLIKISLY